MRVKWDFQFRSCRLLPSAEENLLSVGPIKPAPDFQPIYRESWNWTIQMPHLVSPLNEEHRSSSSKHQFKGIPGIERCVASSTHLKRTLPKPHVPFFGGGEGRQDKKKRFYSCETSGLILERSEKDSRRASEIRSSNRGAVLFDN